jgi:hypothetical protein
MQGNLFYSNSPAPLRPSHRAPTHSPPPVRVAKSGKKLFERGNHPLPPTGG